MSTEPNADDHPTAEGSPSRGSGPVQFAQRAAMTVRNVAEVVRFGGLETDTAISPFTVVAQHPTYRLRHYYAEDVPPDAPAILLVPPLMITAEVWDVAPAISGVASLHAAGLDVWVVDFGHPDREPGGLERTMTDHVLAVSDAVDRVTALTGRPLVLGGYSQGGSFCYQATAFRRGKGIDSIIAFGSPVDASAPLPIPVPQAVVARIAAEIADSGLLAHVALPGWAARFAFKMLTPVKSVRDRITFLLALHDRDALLPREGSRRFLDSEGWTAYSGPAIAEFIRQYFAHNRMLEGGFVIDDRLVTLADLELPIMTVVGTRDTIGHPISVRGIRRAAPRSEVYELSLKTGHFGLVVGSLSSERTWPAVAGWVKWRLSGGEKPADVVPADEVEPTPVSTGETPRTALTTVGELGIGAGKIALGTARRLVTVTRDLATEAPVQLPRLQRLEQLDPSTRISLGLMLDEVARRAPDDAIILFGDRAIRHSAAKHRIDSVVRGLVSVGVRQGERVGVVMQTRPSAFTVVAALSRLGATAVLLRPDGDVRGEATLARVTWIVSDPEHINMDAMIDGVTWCVLGGGAADRELDARVVDLERIDPDQVVLPAWYRPNPQRAGDVAFILFTGEGASTRATKVTNRRWALSALSTATAAALKPGDTVYSVAPIHHSSALLMGVGGAIAAGCRFAMADGTDPRTFWAEVRRYGATHVTYTWTSLREVALAEPNPAEQYHPIRMFMGSGLPRNLWDRLAARFPGVRILEFYASVEGEAILANVSGSKPGSVGRPIPGTPEVRVAAFDLGQRRLTTIATGFAREALADEVGVLLTRVREDGVTDADLLRGVFAESDTWRSTGDLFLRDVAGDLWLAGPVREIVDTPLGPVVPSGARFCLGAIPAVDLAVAYGVPDTDGEALVVAATVLPGTVIDVADLDVAFDRLTPRQRPRYVVVVDTIPLTTWGRPSYRDLQADGVPQRGEGRQVWRLSDERTHYQPL